MSRWMDGETGGWEAWTHGLIDGVGWMDEWVDSWMTVQMGGWEAQTQE